MPVVYPAHHIATPGTEGNTTDGTALPAVRRGGAHGSARRADGRRDVPPPHQPRQGDVGAHHQSPHHSTPHITPHGAPASDRHVDGVRRPGPHGRRGPDRAHGRAHQHGR